MNERQIAVYISGFNAESYDRAGDPAADSDGHVITATVLKREGADHSLVPVRVRIGHGVSARTAATMLRKVADLVERNPDLLSAMPGFAVRRNPDGSAVRRRITPEGLMRAAEQLEGEDRERMLEMIDKIREQITDEPRPEDML